MNNGDYEALIEQITDVIVARLNGDGSAEQAAMCGCTSECFHRCPERMHRIVDAGAARISLVLGQTATATAWASLIDHTLLKPEATDDSDRPSRCFGGFRLQAEGSIALRRPCR